jgi:predicted DNA-binding transcriptional regulator AlpA
MKAEELEAITQLAETLRNNKRIYGLAGLAAFLRCSIPTAKKIADSRAFPKYQPAGSKKIFFIESEVLKGISNDRS